VDGSDKFHARRESDVHVSWAGSVRMRPRLEYATRVLEIATAEVVPGARVPGPPTRAAGLSARGGVLRAVGKSGSFSRGRDLFVPGGAYASL